MSNDELILELTKGIATSGYSVGLVNQVCNALATHSRGDHNVLWDVIYKFTDDLQSSPFELSRTKVVKALRDILMANPKHAAPQPTPLEERLADIEERLRSLEYGKDGSDVE